MRFYMGLHCDIMPMHQNIVSKAKTAYQNMMNNLEERYSNMKQTSAYHVKGAHIKMAHKAKMYKNKFHHKVSYNHDYSGKRNQYAAAAAHEDDEVLFRGTSGI
jgi:hypothetical protein